MKTKKTMALVMATLMCGSMFAACGDNGGGGSSNKTVISLHNNDGGFGTDWLREAEVRFEEKYKDWVAADGKVGIDVDVTGDRESPMTSISTSGYNMFFFEQVSEIRDLAQAGDCLEINDVFTDVIDKRNGQDITLEDKIAEEYLFNLKGRDGNYYGLPNFEYIPSLSYDVELFEKHNLYIADASESNVTTYSSSFGNINFAKAGGKKHCGNDGVYGTDDDGLPTSLQDMLILSSRLSQLTIAPFTFTGMYKGYSNLLTLTLWASLSGYEEMKVVYSFDGDVEVVKRDSNGDILFTNNLLFQGVDGIYAPQTETVTITPETGYRVYDSAARYYAHAFVSAVNKLGYFSQDAETGTVSHTDAQGNFIMSDVYGKKPSAMLIEGNYWWNETEEKAQNLTTYFEETGKSERKIAWMCPPTSVNGAKPVEGKANEVCYLELGASYAIINANIKDKPTIVEACKEFMKFLYTDAELVHYTNSIGCDKALVQYDVPDVDIAKMDYFTQTFQRVAKKADNAKVLYAANYNNNATYLNNPSVFKLKKGKIPCLTYSANGSKVDYESIFEALRANVSLEDIFNSTTMTVTDWATYYVAN